MLLGALMSFGPAGLSALFGGGKDPQKELQRKIRALYAQHGQLSNQYYNTAIHSPAYQGALGSIAAGGNAMAGNVARELGARGIGTSGTGAILSSITPSVIGSQQSSLRAGAFNQAQTQAQNQIQQQIAALLGSQGQPSQAAQMFAGGLDAFAPFLMQWFQRQGGMGNMGRGMPQGQNPWWGGPPTPYPQNGPWTPRPTSGV